MPKLHSIEEILFEMETQANDPSVFGVYNCLAESCSVDEDFIGKAAVIARSVSPRATSLRTIERYLVQLFQIWAIE